MKLSLLAFIHERADDGVKGFVGHLELIVTLRPLKDLDHGGDLAYHILADRQLSRGPAFGSIKLELRRCWELVVE